MSMESQDKTLRRRMHAVLDRRDFIKLTGLWGLSLGAAGLLSACQPTPTQAPTEAPTAAPTPMPTQPPPTEPVDLKMWWWGEEEAPGLGDWLAETVAQYEAANPHINIETVLQSGDALIPAFEAAAAAKEGPDIAFVWAGSYGMPYVWRGDLAPLNDYMAEDVLALDPEIIGTSYESKKYFLTWYALADCVGYNKDIFDQAGLDPDKPPKSWDELLNVCDKVKSIGKTPIVMGFKDLWDCGILYMYMIQQNCDAPFEVLEPAVGNNSYTDPKFLEMWERLEELSKNGFFNDDILSLETFAADEPFVMGEAAIRPRSQVGNIHAWQQEMGEEVVGAMQFPVYGKGKLATERGVGAWWPETLAIPSFAAHPKEAGDFLAFMYTKDRADAMYQQTGVLPGALNLFDLNEVTNPETRKVIDWGYFLHYELVTPVTVDTEGVYKSITDVVAGTATPMQSAEFLDGAVKRWIEQSPDEYEHYLQWVKDIEAMAGRG